MSCSITTGHRPKPLTFEFHHICPREWQRFWHPPTVTPVNDPVYGPVWIPDGVLLCRTHHADVHQGGIVPLMHEVVPTCDKAELRIAQMALDLWTSHGGDLGALRAAHLWGQI